VADFDRLQIFFFGIGIGVVLISTPGSEGLSIASQLRALVCIQGKEGG